MLSRTLIETAKQVDLRTLIGVDTPLRKVANTNGGEYAGPCPFCGGRDRLRVQPERGRWWCRQCGGNRWADAIAYVRRREGIGFAGACERLVTSQHMNHSSATTERTITKQTRTTTPPSAKWQSHAREWLAECEVSLWKDRGDKARAWLINYRGLTKETLRTWHIGYNPTDTWDDPKLWGFEGGKRIFLPRGITIPCEIAGTLWGVKIRRPQGDLKYIQPRGSVPALFGAATLGKHAYAILTEGEFDALLVWQSLQKAINPEWHQVGVATLGSATNQLDVDAWADYLLLISRLLICYDADKEGTRGSEKWSALTQRARRVVVPTLKPGDKDLTDFYRSGGHILDLIVFEMARDEWEREPKVSAEAAHMAQAAHLAQASADNLANPSAQLATITSEWNRLLDQLGTLDQNTPEFDALFAEWEKVDEEYKRLCDRIDLLEVSGHIRQNAAPAGGGIEDW